MIFYFNVIYDITTTKMNSLSLDFEEVKHPDITIKFKDDKLNIYKRKPLFHSKLLKSALEMDTNADIFPLQSVDRETFDEVYKYLLLYEDEETIPEIKDVCATDTNLRNIIKAEYEGSNSVFPSEKDIEYISKYDSGRVIDIVTVADYMDIQSLVRLGCLRIASFLYPYTIKGKENKEMTTKILTKELIVS